MSASTKVIMQYAQMTVAVKTVTCVSTEPLAGIKNESVERELRLLYLRHPNIVCEW